MRKNKNNQTVWSTRTKKKLSSKFIKAGSSIDVDKRLYKEDIAGSIAHVQMLQKQKIISLKTKDKIIWGLKRIKNEIDKKKFNFEKSKEDIHMNIESRLHELIGEDAGLLHTARSRNDQVLTDLKIWMKSSVKELDGLLLKVIKNLILISEKNIKTILPGFTHLKNAQPISLAHYFLSCVEMFKRDRKRFENSFDNLNENPLGVCAIAGTSFNIDRLYTTKKLKFEKPTNNSIDTVSDRDFVLDFLYNISVCSMHISRISEELIIWNSDQYNFIQLKDNLVTGSSIMPQKKNPDTLEFLRGKSGTTYGSLISMLTIVKGLPLSYFKDLQDDKEFVFKSFDTIKNCLIIFNEVILGIVPMKDKMLVSASKGYTTATDLADNLVRHLNITFRDAYKITAKVVNYAEKSKLEFEKLSLDEMKKIDSRITKKILDNIKVKNSIKSKKSYGGTSFENIKKMIKIYKKGIK
tara:strand:- start:13437 stop:14831 length:1395 start_codon:yes stop_codon:yes gene_type:complete